MWKWPRRSCRTEGLPEQRGTGTLVIRAVVFFENRFSIASCAGALGKRVPPGCPARSAIPPAPGQAMRASSTESATPLSMPFFGAVEAFAPRLAGLALRRRCAPIHQRLRDRDQRNAVGNAVMDTHHHGRAALVVLHQMELPQRPIPVQRRNRKFRQPVLQSFLRVGKWMAAIVSAKRL